MINKNISEAQYLRFVRLLERKCGIVLGSTKQYLVKSRLGSIVGHFEFESISDLIEGFLAERDSSLTAAVIEVMTTNETLWFRDQYPFTILEQELLNYYAKLDRPLRIWSAACSSGQEAYSIAMSVAEFVRHNKNALKFGVEISASDISMKMIERSRSGEYDSHALSRGLSEEVKTRYFDPLTEGRMRLKDNIHKAVKFKQLNLLDSYQNMGKFDVVFCRNVLIYFSTELKKQILQKFAASLQDDGNLFLGASESVGKLNKDFIMQRFNSSLYYRKHKGL